MKRISTYVLAIALLLPCFDAEAQAQSMGITRCPEGYRLEIRETANLRDMRDNIGRYDLAEADLSKQQAKNEAEEKKNTADKQQIAGQRRQLVDSIIVEQSQNISCVPY